MISLHCIGQWLQFGRFGGGQGFKTDSLEQEESETLNGEPEIEMDLEKEQFLNSDSCGERRRVEELSSKWSKEKVKLLTEMRACEGEHWIWKEGWPQPGDEEKGKGGKEVKGGHKISASVDGFEQIWAAVVLLLTRKNKIRKIDKNGKNGIMMMNSY